MFHKCSQNVYKMRREGRQMKNCENAISIHGKTTCYIEVCFYINKTCEIFHTSAKRFIAHLRWAYHIESSIVWKLFLTPSSLISWRFSTSRPGFLQPLLDFVVSLQRCAVEIMESLSESRLCQSDNLKMTLSRVKMHFQGLLQTCSTIVLPLSPLKAGCGRFPSSHLHSELNSLAMCVKSAISGHIFLPRIQRHIFIGWTCYCVTLFCNEMFYISWKIDPSATETFVAIIKELSKWREKNNHRVVNKNGIILHMVNSVISLHRFPHKSW